jgi:hypothetical protein
LFFCKKNKKQLQTSPRALTLSSLNVKRYQMGEENHFHHYKPIKSFSPSLRGRSEATDVAIQYLVIADLSAITLNNSLKPRICTAEVFLILRG